MAGASAPFFLYIIHPFPTAVDVPGCTRRSRLPISVHAQGVHVGGEDFFRVSKGKAPEGPEGHRDRRARTPSTIKGTGGVSEHRSKLMLYKSLTVLALAGSSEAFQLPSKLPGFKPAAALKEAAAPLTAAAITFTSEAAHAKSVLGVNGALDFGPLAGDQPGGEGTGKALGVNDDSLFFVLGGVVGTVFFAFSQWQDYQVSLVDDMHAPSGLPITPQPPSPTNTPIHTCTLTYTLDADFVALLAGCCVCLCLCVPGRRRGLLRHVRLAPHRDDRQPQPRHPGRR